MRRKCEKSCGETGLTNTSLRAIITKLFETANQYRGVEQLEARRAHNPEVVGSSPASATIKNTGFRKKSGVFLTFWHKMKKPKIPMGLAVGLVLTLLKVHKGKNPTFLGKFVFLHFRRFLNSFKIDLLVETVYSNLRI